MRALIIGLLLLLGTACGVGDPYGGATPEERDTTAFVQPTRNLVAVLADIEVYRVDVGEDTCYVAIRYQEVAISCVR